MNRIEVFEKVQAHLLKQNKKARGVIDGKDGERCMYRAPDGCRCAVGCLIPDDMYTPECEGHSVDWLLAHVPGFKELLQVDSWRDTAILAALQRLHDQEPVVWWETGLRRVGEQLRHEENMLREPG